MDFSETTVRKFNPNFSELTEPNPLPNICNADFTAFIIPYQLDQHHVHWRLNTFLLVDYYDGLEDRDPDKPITVVNEGYSDKNSVMRRGIKQIVIDAVPFLTFLEDCVERMNKDHLLSIMDTVENYDGPTVIRGVAIKPMPDFAAAIIESCM